MMNVSYKSSAGISIIPLETARFMQREIYLTGEISCDKANLFFQQIMALVDENNRLPITLIINSCGGDIDAGLQMIDTIELCPAPIITICLGKCFSMAAVILACGKKRYILPDSEVMLHEPIVAGGNVAGNISEINAISQTLSEKKKKIIMILQKRTGKTPKTIAAAIENNRYYTADESNAFGITDQTIQNLEEINKTQT